MCTFLEKNNFTVKQHGMFVIQHNKYECKCGYDYTEIYQVLREQVQFQ